MRLGACFRTSDARGVAWLTSSLRQGIEVGAHHIGDAAEPGEAPQVVHGRPPPLAVRAQGLLQRLQGHVQPDLVAVLEAVRDGPRDAR